MTDTRKVAKYYALVVDKFIQMDIDTGALAIFEERQDAEKVKLKRQEIIEVDVSRSLESKYEGE